MTSVLTKAPPGYWVSRKFFDPEYCDLFLLDCLFLGLAFCCLSAAASLNLTSTESLTSIVNIFGSMFPSAWMASETLSAFAVITWYFATFLTRKCFLTVRILFYIDSLRFHEDLPNDF